MAIFVPDFLPDGWRRMLPVLSALPTCLAALHSIPPAKPSRSAVVVLEMRALGSKMPDVDLRNPDPCLAHLSTGKSSRKGEGKSGSVGTTQD
jgi:hypothetical protein